MAGQTLTNGNAGGNEPKGNLAVRSAGAGDFFRETPIRFGKSPIAYGATPMIMGKRANAIAHLETAAGLTPEALREI